MNRSLRGPPHPWMRKSIYSFSNACKMRARSFSGDTASGRSRPLLARRTFSWSETCRKEVLGDAFVVLSPTPYPPTKSI
jgi:hypothetical protein